MILCDILWFILTNWCRISQPSTQRALACIILDTSISKQTTGLPGAKFNQIIHHVIMSDRMHEQECCFFCSTIKHHCSTVWRHDNTWKNWPIYSIYHLLGWPRQLFRKTTEPFRGCTGLNIEGIWVLWQTQCYTPKSPTFMGGINLPFPVMGGLLHCPTFTWV